MSINVHIYRQFSYNCMEMILRNTKELENYVSEQGVIKGK